MKIYIAARFSRAPEVRYIANALKAHGHVVTSRWHEGAEEESGSAAAAAQMDIDDVFAAEAVLFIGEPQGSKNTGGGRWFELGYGYAIGKRCMAVLAEGDDPRAMLGVAEPRHESVFTSLPVIETYGSIEAALARLG